jgi:hypothetical protein
VEAVHDLVAAGVVTVIAAGNDRDEFGLGSAGSPGSAPDAISVAAVSNTHVFAPALDVTDPGVPDVLKGIPFIAVNQGRAPAAWGATDQRLVDAGSVAADPRLCTRTPDAGSLDGSIVLVDRGICALADKAQRAKLAGAVGIVFADNREGEANGCPSTPRFRAERSRTSTPHTYAPGWPTTAAGRASGSGATLELETGRSGVVTSFSSGADRVRARAEAGRCRTRRPDPVLHPAAHGQLALRRVRRHVDGDAARRGRCRAPVAQLHPAWTPEQVKSALVSTAGAAWGDTARTHEAPVTLEGGGLVGCREQRTRSCSRSPPRSRSAISAFSSVTRRGECSFASTTRAAAPGRGRCSSNRRRRPQGRPWTFRVWSQSRLEAKRPCPWSRTPPPTRLPARTTASSSCTRER